MNIIDDFLKNSNWIEREYSERAFLDAQKAWSWAWARRKEPLGLKHILKIHHLLLKNIKPHIAGKLRTCDVYIGGERKEFINSSRLKTDIKSFTLDYERIISCKDSVPVDQLEAMVQENHVKFEKVHPFEDGNGRTGRILWQLLRVKCGLPYKVIRGWGQGQDEFHEEQKEYYGWFRNKKIDDKIINFLINNI